MRVAYLSMGNPTDRSNWSGTPFFALQEMQRRLPDLAVIETPRLDGLTGRLIGPSRRLGLDITRNPLVQRCYAQSIEGQLQSFRPDAVLAVGGAYKLARISDRWPVVFVSDGLFCSVVDYYAKFRALSPATRQRAMRLERDFTRPASHRFALMSQWAAETAMAAHSIPASRVRVVPIGANLEQDPGRSWIDQPKPALDLLWVGVDWQRKGGAVLLAAFAALRERMPQARLHIVGVTPPQAQHQPGVTVHGYLRKSDPAEREKLLNLFASAFLFVMPSREEAFGLVYCEAAAFGVPSIAYRTGGVTTIVDDGRTGLLLPMDAAPVDFGDAILSLWNDRGRYDAMRRAARERYESVLNWAAWGDAIEQELALAVRTGKAFA